jgi:hypothetical protein
MHLSPFLNLTGQEYRTRINPNQIFQPDHTSNSTKANIQTNDITLNIESIVYHTIRNTIDASFS